MKHFLFSLLLCAAVAASAQDSQVYLREANTCFDKGDYECAKTNYMAYVNIAGTAAMDVSGRLRDAEECMKAMMLADGYYNEQDYARAEVQYKKILEKNPNDPRAGTRLANIRAINLANENENRNRQAAQRQQRQQAAMNTNVIYSAHVQNIGWQASESNGATSGTVGINKRLEAFRIRLDCPSYFGNIKYKAHVESLGWQSYTTDNEFVGTIGQGKRIEAIQIILTGEIATILDVYYRVHIQNSGWSNWVSNGEIAGTTGRSLRIEAFEVFLRKK